MLALAERGRVASADASAELRLVNPPLRCPCFRPDVRAAREREGEGERERERERDARAEFEFLCVSSSTPPNTHVLPGHSSKRRG